MSEVAERDANGNTSQEAEWKPAGSGSSFTRRTSPNTKDQASAVHPVGKPICWERFLAADEQPAFCACPTIFGIVMLVVFAGMQVMELSDGFGFFVLGDEVTQAYLAHQEYIDTMPYFTDTPSAWNPLVINRSQPIPLATIFMEAKGTKCPGEECDLKSKNLITAKYLRMLKQIEERIWNDQTFQARYCALLNDRQDARCYPPESPLSMLLWSDNATEASKSLAEEGYYDNSEVSPAQCQAWQSPMDNQQNTCSTSAWTHLSANSGAAEPSDLQSYSEVIKRLCNENNSHMGDLRQKWLPNFACDDGHMEKHGVPFLRSQIVFGLPWDRNRYQNDIDYPDQFEDLADEYGTDFFELFDKVIEDVVGDDDDINVSVQSPVSVLAVQQDMQNRTLAFTGASFLFVFLYMWFNVESFFLAWFGMLQVIFSLFPTVLAWHLYNEKGIQFLQFLAVFMILGIGADNVFVLNDAWKQAKHELAEVGDYSNVHIFVMAYRRSFFAMLATTMTTAVAFFFGVFNPIPAISDFCIFACLIVLFDYILCISMFAACVAFHERFMANHVCFCCGPKPSPGACCQPGCCWGGTRILWRRFRNIPVNQTTNQRSLELFFSGPLFNFLKKFKYALIAFWTILLIAAVVSAIFGVKITEEDPQGLPDDHPLQRARDIQRDYFTLPAAEQVNVIWGLDDKGAVEEWASDEAERPTKINFIDISAVKSKDGQRRILSLCTAPDERAGSLRCNEKSCLVKGAATNCQTDTQNGTTYNVDPLCQTGRYCIMEQVKEYADLNNYSWPLDDFDAVVGSSDFISHITTMFDVMREKKQHWHAENYKKLTGVVLEGPPNQTKVKYMWMTFNATFEGFFLTPDAGTKIYDDWEAFISSHVGGTKYFQVHLMYLFKVLQDILVEEAFKSIGASLLVAFATLAMVTWNWWVATLGFLNITFIIAYFLGLWPILGWELDIFNVIFCIMSVGLSVDYTVHLLHAYNECEETERELRVAAALSSMGITVLSGAITTLLAASPLLFTVPTFFNRFGTFVFITISFSILTSVLLLVPLLLVMGPNGRFGDIMPFYWLQERCCTRKTIEKVSSTDSKDSKIATEVSIKHPVQMDPTSIISV